MNKKHGVFVAIVFSAVFLFVLSSIMESTAWARAGGGASSGSRGSRSFSSPSMPPSRSPSSPSPSPGSGFRPSPSYPNQPSSGWFSRSPFAQGLAGGLAGGFLGSLLFGGMGHASPMGGMGGGGIGLMDIIIIGALIYFGLKFFKRRREFSGATAYQREEAPHGDGGPYGMSQPGLSYPGNGDPPRDAVGEMERGIFQIRQMDPLFNLDTFKETAQDIFFRIQAGWMNRSLDGIEDMFTPEMAALFKSEFEQMKQKGTINRLENIAVRKVEPSEVWQETGKDYVTVLFTANLLDYTVDDKSGQVVSGDKLNPVKFEEFWTFCRDIRSSKWQLSAINQA